MIVHRRIRFAVAATALVLLTAIAGCEFLWPLDAAISVSTTSGYAPLEVTFDSRPSTGPVVARAWDFGDPASGADNASTLARPIHTFTDDGTYAVTLTVYDDEGAASQATAIITVLNPPPVAQLTASPTHGPAPLEVTFDLSSSIDPAGIVPTPTGTIVAYILDFGDGTIPATGSNVSTSIQHSYSTAGRYLATLTVVDDDGASASTTRIVSVEGVVASYATPGNDPVGLAFDGAYLWLSDWSAERIYKIRTSDGQAVSSFEAPGAPTAPLSLVNAPSAIVLEPVDEPGTPAGLAWGDGGLWVACLSDGKIYKINPSVPTTDPGHELAVLENAAFVPFALAYGGGYLWVSDLATGSIFRVSPATGVVVTAVEASRLAPRSVSIRGIVVGPVPTGLAWADGFLWASSGSTLYKIEPWTGAIVGSMSAPGPSPFGLAYDGTSLWNADPNGTGLGRLYRLIAP